MWNSIFFIALLFLPMQFALSRVPGFDVASGRVIIVGIFFMWLFTSLKNRSVRFPSHISFWLPILFLCLSALSLIGAQQLGWGVRKWLFLANMFLWIVVSLSLLAQKKISVRVLAQGIAWSGGAAAAVGLFQFFLPHMIGLEGALTFWRAYVAPRVLGTTFSETVEAFPSWLVNVGGETIFRAVGLFPDPHMLALFLELTLPWAIFLAIYSQKHSVAYWGLSGVILAGIFATFSRGAYLGFFIGGGGALLWLLFSKKRVSFAYIAGAVSIVILLLGSILYTENSIRERLFAVMPFTDTSTEGRLHLWRHAWGVSLQEPFLGVGLGNYASSLEPSALYRSPITAHNTYLDIAVETGIFTFFVWITMMIMSARGYIRGLEQKGLYAAGIFSLAMYSVHAFFETALYSVHGVPLWCIIIAMGMFLDVEYKTK